jgi:hypothetical protein
LVLQFDVGGHVSAVLHPLIIAWLYSRYSFDEQHSAAAVRTRAIKIREISGAHAVPHTPMVLR